MDPWAQHTQTPYPTRGTPLLNALTHTYHGPRAAEEGQDVAVPARKGLGLPHECLDAICMCVVVVGLRWVGREPGGGGVIRLERHSVHVDMNRAHPHTKAHTHTAGRLGGTGG